MGLDGPVFGSYKVSVWSLSLLLVLSPTSSDVSSIVLRALLTISL